MLCAQRDLNPHPFGLAPKASASANSAMNAVHARRESNPQPLVLETSALPIELRTHVYYHLKFPFLGGVTFASVAVNVPPPLVSVSLSARRLNRTLPTRIFLFFPGQAPFVVP